MPLSRAIGLYQLVVVALVPDLIKVAALACLILNHKKKINLAKTTLLLFGISVAINCGVKI